MAALGGPVAGGPVHSCLASCRWHLHEAFADGEQQDAAEAMCKLDERCVAAHARLGGHGPAPLPLPAGCGGYAGSWGAPLGIAVREDLHCIGCGRSREEMKTWKGMKNKERKAVNEVAAQRLKQLGKAKKKKK